VRSAGGRRRRASASLLTLLVDKRHDDGLAVSVRLEGRLYVGGVPQSVSRRLEPVVRSRRGFSGCLSTLVVSGRLYDIIADAELVSDSVTAGCTTTTSTT